MQFITPILLCSSGNPEGRKVYASEESVKRLEFYQANASGHKIEKVITIRKFEYANEESAKINGEKYTVLRVYDLNDGNIQFSLIKEVRYYDEAATLIWNEIEDGVIIDKSQNVLVREDTFTSTEFYASYQIGTNQVYLFKMTKTDYELTKRIDADTKKPLYARKLKYKEAVYDIIQAHYIKDIDEIDLICS